MKVAMDVSSITALTITTVLVVKNDSQLAYNVHVHVHMCKPTSTSNSLCISDTYSVQETGYGDDSTDRDSQPPIRQLRFVKACIIYTCT